MGMTTARAASRTRSTSACPISRFFPETATTPRELRLSTEAPPRDAQSPVMVLPASCSAASTAFATAVLAAWILTTTPFRRPSEWLSPQPDTRSLPPRTVLGKQHADPVGADIQTGDYIADGHSDFLHSTEHNMTAPHIGFIDTPHGIRC